MDKEYSIWLAERPNCSARFCRRLLDALGTARNVWEADEDRLRDAVQAKKNQLDSLMQKGLEHSRRIMSDCEKHGIRPISIAESDYPEPLRSMDNAPIVLYVRGNMPDWKSSLSIAMVGTRRATKYGLSAAHWLSGNLAKAGCVIVSGMAKGIDSQANRGALDVGGQTVAVMGCGLDICYPYSNKQLMDDIVRHGAVISEYPPGTDPAAWHFPQRNRIISGLCRGLVVIEAPMRSGALITADWALNQGKDVFAVPGNINSPASMGTNQLVRQGAELVTCAEEILTHYPEELQRISPPTARYIPTTQPEQSADKETARERPKEPKPQNTQNRNEKTAPAAKNTVALRPDEQMILQSVRNGAKCVDEILDATDMSASNALAALTMLEINGILHRVGSTIVLDIE